MAYEYELEDELEGELEDESSLEGEGWLGAIGNIASSLLGEVEEEYEEELEDEGEGEEEYEDESPFEGEDEISPIRKIYPDAMMEHLGQLAAEAETEDEAAEHFLPLTGMAASKLLPVVARAVAPMAKKALPKIARAVTKASPHLTKSIGKVAKTLHRNPTTRHLLKTVPAIARRTVGSIARQAARGRHITPRTAVRTLAKQARHVLAHPGHRKHALRHHNHLEKRFHRYHGRRHHPHWRYGQRWHGRYPRGYRYGQAPHVTATGHVAPGYVAPGYVATGHAATGAAPVVHAPGIRPGRVVGRSCTCPACPTALHCRCCGQVLR
jgi:hypothetical protein